MKEKHQKILNWKKTLNESENYFEFTTFELVTFVTAPALNLHGGRCARDEFVIIKTDNIIFKMFKNCKMFILMK